MFSDLLVYCILVMFKIYVHNTAVISLDYLNWWILFYSFCLLFVPKSTVSSSWFSSQSPCILKKPFLSFFF